MSFALMGDMILCARSSYFLQAFRRIGLVPDCGSTWPAAAADWQGAPSVELSLMGEKLPAEKALEWGLVNRVHDDAVLMDEAMKLAHELANGPTVALSLIRKLYWDSPDNSFEDQLNLEFELQRMAGATEDFKEGVTAFLEKRPAKFKGQEWRRISDVASARGARARPVWPTPSGCPAAPARRPGRSISCIPMVLSARSCAARRRATVLRQAGRPGWMPRPR